ncbi:MAG: hypothetical protein AAGI24_03665 [Pseudomonadota bacterium]
MQSFRTYFAAVFLGSIALSGCKVTITPPESGSVVSQSGAFNCTASSPCEIDIIDATFNEVFVAMPNEGFEFDEWRDESAHFCRGTEGTCTISSLLLAGNAQLLAVLLLDLEFFLIPEFERSFDDISTTWTGSWETTNSTATINGDITLDISQVDSATYEVTLDLDGAIGDIMDPAAQTITVPLDSNGDLTFSDGVDLGGEDGNLSFTLTDGGELTFSIDDIPQQAFNSMQATGFLGTDSGSLDWSITLATGVRIKGTAAVSRS